MHFDEASKPFQAADKLISLVAMKKGAMQSAWHLTKIDFKSDAVPLASNPSLTSLY